MYTTLEDNNGRRKSVKNGFSWTSLLFGVFVPMFRGDLTGLMIQLVLALITGGLSWFVVPFFYNSRYKDRLIDKGYREV